jgi:hypothetical protein
VELSSLYLDVRAPFYVSGRVLERQCPEHFAIFTSPGKIMARFFLLREEFELSPESAEPEMSCRSFPDPPNFLRNSSGKMICC